MSARAPRCFSTGKISFRTKGKAQRALERVRNLGPRRVYRCTHCGYWHMTKRPAVKDRRLAEPKVTVPELARPAPPQPWEPRPSRRAA